jgi:hypothetical protein
MPSIFYKHFWHLLGEKVKKEVLDVLNGGDMPPGWNDTVIVLIPKVKQPEKLKDLRPISLCNVLYKLISKVLANRLKNVLPEIISPSQSAFVPGRLITDNVLLAYELTHHLNKKRKGASGLAAIKLDMSKAYDRIEWPFLKKMMQRLDFQESWVNLIMKCVTTVSCRIKVDGEYTDSFSPNGVCVIAIHCHLISSYCVRKVCQFYCKRLKLKGRLRGSVSVEELQGSIIYFSRMTP